MSPPASPSNKDVSSNTTVYFGYGSNLWLEQMSLRCPTAQYLGVARLNNYTWLINDRGYANVVAANTSSTNPASVSNSASQNYTNTVYGLVYTLHPSDVSRLDKNEGVPVAYTKEYLACDFWAAAGGASDPLAGHEKVDTVGPPTVEGRSMLVYIDRVRVEPDVPRKEYVYRMNRGIEDALAVGVPRGYVDEVMRKYIKEEEKGGEGGEEDVGSFAREQAKGFKDESGVFR